MIILERTRITESKKILKWLFQKDGETIPAKNMSDVAACKALCLLCALCHPLPEFTHELMLFIISISQWRPEQIRNLLMSEVSGRAGKQQSAEAWASCSRYLLSQLTDSPILSLKPSLMSHRSPLHQSCLGRGWIYLNKGQNSRWNFNAHLG